MIKFYDSEILQILPLPLRDNPKIQAVSYAIQMANRRMIQLLHCSMVYAGVDYLQEKALDLLAIELRTPYYDTTFPVETKRKVIKNTFCFYSKAGTVSAVEEMLNCIVGSGKVEEWFEYGGRPGYFQVLFSDVEEIDAKKKAEFKQLLNQIKRASSHLDKIIYQFHYYFFVLIYYENVLLIRSQFCFRNNAVFLFLDGSAGLDGVYQMNGYTGEDIDFYPIQFRIRGEILQKIDYFEQIKWFSEVKLVLKAAAETRIRSEFYPRYNIPLFRLDGTQYLDGTHTLNEMDQDFEPLFLDGVGSLNGEYITNGYMDCHNFDFYPLIIKIRVAYEQKSAVSGFFHSVLPIPISIQHGSSLNIVGSVKKEVITGVTYLIQSKVEDRVFVEGNVTVEKDLYFLNGERGLDGDVFLDADIYQMEL
ncbi:MAG: phage tail protein I [Lachnospiraceae bacterium]|nr:phage tail protein I [Lachnospiraceae bacterium]